MFLIFQYIAICIDKWKQAVLFKESYRYIDMPHINDTPTTNPSSMQEFCQWLEWWLVDD